MSRRPPTAGGSSSGYHHPPSTHLPAPPTDDYLSPDPYPEESDEPLPGEEREYSEAEIDDSELPQQPPHHQQHEDREYQEVPYEEQFYPHHVEHHEEDVIPPPAAPVPAPSVQRQTSSRGSSNKKTTPSSSSSSAHPSVTSIASRFPPSIGSGANQAQASQRTNLPKPPAATVVSQHDNPFEDATELMKPVTSSSTQPTRTLHPSSRNNSSTAQHTLRASSASPTNASSSSAHPADTTGHSTSAPPPNTSSSSLPKSNSLPQKMNELLDKGMLQFEKHSDAFINNLRGLEEVKKDKVDDELLSTLNYDDISDHVNELALNAHSKHSGHILTFLQLLLTITIALVTAVAMYLVSHLVEWCFDHRVDATITLIMSGDPYGAYFAFLGASLFLGAVATILVTYFAPHAKGGGVPYVQAYLNGTNVSSYFSPRIVLIKIAALGFTIASGLSLGMEGPFVFIGSGIAIILCKALEYFSFHQRLGGKYTRILKNINEERVFMAGGMAAGLAVAFNAPIAGVLMALEGSTAFLTVPVVLRIFGCAMFATFFNDLGHANFSKNIKTHNLIMITTQPNAPDYAWVIPEIICFLVIAVLGGLLGALAIWINVKLTKWRHHTVEPHPPKNQLNTVVAVGEVLTLVFLTATVWFVLPYVFGCRMQHEQCFPTIAVPKRCMQVQCPDKYYSEIGTIIYSPSDTIARILFDRTLLPVNDLQPFPLLIYAAFYLCFASVLYGSHVPGGLFVPSIVVGGCMGRNVGWIVHTYISSAVNPGVYALLGAASMFGGFTRLALPAVIMLIEMTGDATYLLPIMFCTVVAKVVSDWIVPALYPQHMAIEGIPTLGDTLNPLIAPLSAKQIMNKTFYSVNQVDTLDHILDTLDKSKSMLLPVTTTDGKFVGMIMRRSLIYALKYSTKYQSEREIDDSSTEGAASLPGASSVTAIDKKMGSWDDTTDYAKSIDRFDDKMGKALINLTPFMDAGALTAHESTSAKRVAAIFRRLGISHLGVSDGENKLIGVITRRHLLKPPAAVTAQPLSVTTQRTSVDSIGLVGLDSPSADVADLAEYDRSQDLEQSAMVSSELAQRRSVMARRSNSILMGFEPVVKFDDEEDVDEATTLDMTQQDLGAGSPLDSPNSDDDENGGMGMQSQSFRDATGYSFDQAAAAQAQAAANANRTPNEALNTTGGSSTGGGGGVGASASKPKSHQSSLSRLNAYTKEL